MRGFKVSKNVLIFTYINMIAVSLFGRKGNWIGHILRRNCPIKHIIHANIEGRKEATRRRGRRPKQLLCNLKETGGYWKLDEAALHHRLKRIRCGRGCGPVVRQNTERIIKM
jgi:hypothetical protein